MAELRFTLEARDTSVVVGVQGELDVVSSQRFDDWLSEAGGRSNRVILDLSGVDFMDTTTLAVIVRHWRRKVAAGGLFLLAGARYRYTKALWITGLADRLPMYDTVEQALAAGQAGDPAQAGGPARAGQPARAEPGAAAANGHGARKSGEPGNTAG